MWEKKYMSYGIMESLQMEALELRAPDSQNHMNMFQYIFAASCRVTSVNRLKKINCLMYEKRPSFQFS